MLGAALVWIAVLRVVFALRDRGPVPAGPAPAEPSPTSQGSPVTA
jgi:cytochrome c oxidase assembly protein subunit 15